MSSIQVIVYPPDRHFVLAPNAFYLRRWPEDSAPFGPETNPHFIGRFTQPQHNVLRKLRENEPNDIGVTFETNIHFIGKFTQPQFSVLASLRQNSDSTPAAQQIEWNPSFIAKFQPVQYFINRRLHQREESVGNTPLQTTSVSWVWQPNATTQAVILKPPSKAWNWLGNAPTLIGVATTQFFNLFRKFFEPQPTQDNF